MKILVLFALFGSIGINLTAGAGSVSKVVCFLDSTGFVRTGVGMFTLKSLESALPLCTHLMYGYIGLDPQTFDLILQKKNSNDSNEVLNNIKNLKVKFPHLKIFMSIGEGIDTERPESYMTILEDKTAQITFLNRIHTALEKYNFDGLDLAWQFARNKPLKKRNSIRKFFSNIKNALGFDSSIPDEKYEEHRQQFTDFLIKLKSSFHQQKYQLSLTVLPNVNSSLFYDIPALINNLDFINLAVFDYQTPERNPHEADYPAPIMQPNERNPEYNINYEVKYWINNKCPQSKLIIGINVYGRVWKITKDSNTLTGFPPIKYTENESPPGHELNMIGKYSWPEICSLLPNPGNQYLKGEKSPLVKVNDPSNKLGTYAYRLPDQDGNYGLWIGYDSPEMISHKIKYIHDNGLGGIALFDLTGDDFRGVCNGVQFPILNAAAKI